MDLAMSDTNPYTPPVSNLDNSNSNSVAAEFKLSPPRAVGVGRGASWLGEGFEFFKQGAGHWILTCIVGFVLMMIIGLLPLINLVAGLFTYVWVGGLMLGLRDQDQGERFEIKHLFAGFGPKFGQLLLLGVIVTAISMVLTVAFLGSMYWQLITGSMDSSWENFGAGMAIRVLLLMALMIPLMMAVWLAPALIAIHDTPVITAMKLSFFGCLKNVLPFLIYGILAMILFIIGALPLGLGLLIVMPMFFGSIYAAYKDIYVYENL
jgi:hypothetical protein